jgi:hypothetical protein
MSFNAGSNPATSNKASNRFDISHCSSNALLKGPGVEKSHDRILIKTRTMRRDKYNIGEAWAVTVDPDPEIPNCRRIYKNLLLKPRHSLFTFPKPSICGQSFLLCRRHPQGSGRRRLGLFGAPVSHRRSTPSAPNPAYNNSAIFRNRASWLRV